MGFWSDKIQQQNGAPGYTPPLPPVPGPVRFAPTPPPAPVYQQAPVAPQQVSGGTFQEVIDHPESYQGKHTRALQEEEAVSGDCPECGSNNYFARAKTGRVLNTTTGTMAQPAPHCMDCGHNGLYDLQGGALTSIGGASTPGRQLPTAGFQGRTIIGRVE